jgi:hypothetical protein
VLSEKAVGAAIVVMTNMRPPRIDQLATAIDPACKTSLLERQAARIGTRYCLAHATAPVAELPFGCAP